MTAGLPLVRKGGKSGEKRKSRTEVGDLVRRQTYKGRKGGGTIATDLGCNGDPLINLVCPGNLKGKLDRYKWGEINDLTVWQNEGGN